MYAFECNPDGIEECKKNNPGHIRLIEKAVSCSDDHITFLPFDKEKQNNIGASSIYEIDFVTSRSKNDGDQGKSDVQKRIQVPSVRLDTFCLQEKVIPDVIFMDVQEAELEVLRSGFTILSEVKQIVTECSIQSTYKGGTNIFELIDFLEGLNFELISHNKSKIQKSHFYKAEDFVFKNKNY